MRSTAVGVLGVTWALAVMLAGSGASVAFAAPESEVAFADAALKACVAEELKRPAEAPVTQRQMARLWSLECDGVWDIAPLAYSPDLNYLFLKGAALSDISALTSLRALRSVTLDDSGVSDLSPLANSTTLTSLSARRTKVESLVPLSTIPNLEMLKLDATLVNDLGPLADLSSLKRLHLSDTDVADLSPLAGLTQLQSLEADRANLSDLAPLASVTSLTNLRVETNTISDVSPLAGLTGLRRLLMSENRVSDLRPLIGLPELSFVSFHSNAVTDLVPFSGLKPGTLVGLLDNEASAPEAIAGIPVPNPVRDSTGVPVPLSAPASCVDMTCSEVVYAETGKDVTANWRGRIAVGEDSYPFTGTLTRDVIEPPLTVAPDGLTGTGTPSAKITITDGLGVVQCGPIDVTQAGTWACSSSTSYGPGEYKVNQAMNDAPAGSITFLIGAASDHPDEIPDTSPAPEADSDEVTAHVTETGADAGHRNAGPKLALTGGAVPAVAGSVGILLLLSGVWLRKRGRVCRPDSSGGTN